MPDLVECRSDFEYPQRPLAFYWQGIRLEVAELISQGRSPKGFRFLVKSRADGIFELFYDLDADQWSVKQI